MADCALSPGMVELLAWLRARHSTSVAAAAALRAGGVAVSHVTLHRWEHGYASPTQAHAVAIEKLTGIDHCSFCPWHEGPDDDAGAEATG